MARKSTEAVIIHCTATLAHQDFRRAEIDAMHKRRGFSGIGYHYLIALDGEIEVGRAPENSVGAHVAGFNDRTLGVAYVGGLRSSDAMPSATMNAAQLKSLESLLRGLCKRYPTAVILGHRDLSPDLNNDGIIQSREWMKICPCFDAAKWAKSKGLPGGKYVKGRFVEI